jgi:hypothetical protein
MRRLSSSRRTREDRFVYTTGNDISLETHRCYHVQLTVATAGSGLKLVRFLLQLAVIAYFSFLAGMMCAAWLNR